MKVCLLILFLSSITLGFPVGPLDFPKFWNDGVYLKQHSSRDKESAKRDTFDMIPKDNLPNEIRLEVNKSPQLTKPKLEDLIRSFGLEYATRAYVIDQELDKTLSNFPRNSKTILNPFSAFHMDSKKDHSPSSPLRLEAKNIRSPFSPYRMESINDRSPFSPIPVSSKHEINPFLPFSMDFETNSKPFSRFPIESKNKVHSFTHFPMSFTDNFRPFNDYPFPSKTRQHSFSPFPISPKVSENPFSPFPIMPKKKTHFSPTPLRSFPPFPSRNFDISSGSFPLTLDDSPIVIEIVNDAEPIELDAKLKSILKKLSKTKSHIKHHIEQNSNENSKEAEENIKPCPREEITPEHGVCIMTVLGLLILIPLITTCLLKKFKPAAPKKAEPVRI